MKILFIEGSKTGGGSLFSLIALINAVRYLNVKCQTEVVYFSSRPAYKEIFELNEISYRFSNLWFRGEYNPVINSIFKIVENFVAMLSLFSAQLAESFSDRVDRRVYNELKSRISEGGFDILHVNSNPVRCRFAVRAGLDSNAILFCHLRSFNCDFISDEYVFLLNERVASFIAYSVAIKRFWVKKGILDEKIVVIPNGIDLSDWRFFDESDSASLWDTDFSIRIGFLGKVIPERNLGYFHRILPRLLDEFRSVKIVVGGEISDAQKRMFFRQIDRKHHQYFEFRGRVKPLDFYKTVDLLVLPYLIEPFGRTVLESMALGVPCLVSDVDDIVDNFSDSQCVSTFSLMNDSSFFEALECLKDPYVRSAVLRDRRGYCETHFSHLRHGSAVYELYSKHIGRQ